MRLTCIICTVNLIILGICGGVFAFSGLNILPYMFFGNVTALRCFLAVCFVSALFEIYAMLIFRPFKGLK